jgi:hypothetical protein
MRLTRRTAFLAALLATLAATSPAMGATKKLYTVSMSGRDTADVTRSWVVPPNSERCTGEIRDTRHLTSSFGVSPVRWHPVTPNRKFGWLSFKARITSPHYTARRDTSGDWGIDLGEPDQGQPEPPPREPGECEFTHENRDLKCHWWKYANSRRGWLFTLVPVDGRYNVIVDLDFNSILECERHENLQLIQTGPPRTKLTEAAVKRLRAGKHVRVSGTVEISYDSVGDTTSGYDRGHERFRYTLTVTRVR